MDALDEAAIDSGGFKSLECSCGKLILAEDGRVSATRAQATGSGECRGDLSAHIAPLAIDPDLLIRRRVRIHVEGIVYGNGSEAKNVELRPGHFSLQDPPIAWLSLDSPGRG